MQKNRKIRLAVDANVWISALLSTNFRTKTNVSDFRTRINIVFNPKYRLLVSKELFEELANTIRKPRLEKQIDRTNYEELVALLHNVAELVNVRSKVEICRDPKDNFLLALAKDGNADYLITGDKDLLVLGKIEKTKIVKLTEFESATRQAEPQA